MVSGVSRTWLAAPPTAPAPSESGFRDPDSSPRPLFRPPLPRMRELWIVLAECQTAEWVETANRVSGVAPSSWTVWARYQHFRGAAPDEFQPRRPLRKRGSQRVWVMRCRRRWGGKLCNFAPCDIDPAEILQQNASEVSSTAASFSTHPRSPTAGGPKSHLRGSMLVTVRWLGTAARTPVLQ